MTELARLPYDAACGAEIDDTTSDSVNESVGGISGRLSNRHATIREFHLTIGPDDSAEVRALYRTHRQRWPVAVRDWSNYIYTDEPQTWIEDTSFANVELRRKIMPATGSRFLYERILVPDEAEVETVIKINGTPLLRSDWSFADVALGPGVAQIPIMHVGTGASITASGRYLVAAAFKVGGSLTSKVYRDGLVGIPTVLLREILETELVSMMNQADDSE